MSKSISKRARARPRARPYSNLASAHSFLFQLMGQEPELDVVALDHAYARAWNLHPQASRAKPMVTLFMTPGLRSTASLTGRNGNRGEMATADNGEEIDVVGVDDKLSLSYDVGRAKTSMRECEEGLSFVREVQVADEGWEEKLVKSGWSSTQSRFFNKVVRELTADRLARLSLVGTKDEALQIRLLVDKTSKRFRQVLATFQWDRRLCAWLHKVVVDHFPRSYMVAYLDILQTLKSKLPSLVDRLLCAAPLPSTADAKPTPKSPPHPSPKSPPPALPTEVADPEALASLLKRPWDPLGSVFIQQRLRRMPANPIFLLAADIPPAPGTTSYTKRKKFWHQQLSALGKVIPITVHSNLNNPGMAQQCLENMINTMRLKLRELRQHYSPDERPIVLVGWGVGSLVSTHVALLEVASAVVCLGFPFSGIGGTRGDVDDPFFQIRTPTLFILGQRAPLSPLDEVEALRERLPAETSLVWVGGADDELRMSRRKKQVEGITQSIVDRCIIDEILDFLLGVFSSSTPLFDAAAATASRRNGTHNPSGVNISVGASNGFVRFDQHPNVSTITKSRKRVGGRSSQSLTSVAPDSGGSTISSIRRASSTERRVGPSQSTPEMQISSHDLLDEKSLSWSDGAAAINSPLSSVVASPKPVTLGTIGYNYETPFNVGISGGGGGMHRNGFGNVKTVNGSRGKVKSKKQGGNAKKAAKSATTTPLPPPPTFEKVLNSKAPDSSKVYGMSGSRASHTSIPSSSVKVSIASSTNIASSQSSSFVANAFAAAAAAAAAHKNRRLCENSTSSSLTTQQQKLMGSLLAAGSSLTPHFNLASPTFSPLMTPALAASAVAASGNPTSIHQQILPGAGSKMSVIGSNSSSQSQSPQVRPVSFVSPMRSVAPGSLLTTTTTKTATTVVKMPRAGFMLAGMTTATSPSLPTPSSSAFLAPPSSVKRPTILQQVSGENSSSSFDLTSSNLRLGRNFHSAAAAAASSASSSAASTYQQRQVPMPQRGPSPVQRTSLLSPAETRGQPTANRTNAFEKSHLYLDRVSMAQPSLVQRKTVITSAVIQGSSDQDGPRTYQASPLNLVKKSDISNK